MKNLVRPIRTIFERHKVNAYSQLGHTVLVQVGLERYDLLFYPVDTDVLEFCDWLER